MNAFVALLAGLPVAFLILASARAVYVPAGGGPLEAACAQPSSAACTAALEQLARRTADDLTRVAQTGRPEYKPLARFAATMPFPSVRAAGAGALGHFSPSADDTALLSDLLNDPVPLVRRAAHAAIQQSSDPAARPLAQRARGNPGDGARPQKIPAAGELKVPLYAGTRFLFFASNLPEGQSEFQTADAYDKVIAFYAGTLGRGLTFEEFEAQGRAQGKPQGKAQQGMPDMNSPEMKNQIQAAMDAQKAYQDAISAGKSPQDAAQAMMNTMAKKAPADPSRISNAMRQKEVYGSPRLFVVEKGMAPGAPARLVAVYKDLLLGKTGIAIFTGPIGLGDEGR